MKPRRRAPRFALISRAASRFNSRCTCALSHRIPAPLSLSLEPACVKTHSHSNQLTGEKKRRKQPRGRFSAWRCRIRPRQRQFAPTTRPVACEPLSPIANRDALERSAREESSRGRESFPSGAAKERKTGTACLYVCVGGRSRDLSSSRVLHDAYSRGVRGTYSSSCAPCRGRLTSRRGPTFARYPDELAAAQDSVREHSILPASVASPVNLLNP